MWSDEGVQIVNYDNQFAYYSRGMTPDGLGGLYFTWRDTRYSEEEYHHELWANRIGSDGTPLWGDSGIPIAQDGRSNGGKSQVARLSDNSIICVYLKQIEDNDDLNIFAQRVDIDGNLLWDSEVPICTEIEDQWIFDIYSDGENEVYMIWKDYRNGISNLFAQKINSEGEVQWQENGVDICNYESAQVQFNYMLDQNNYLIAVWVDTRNAYSSQYDIFAQMISPNGNLLWEPDGMQISVAEDMQQYPTLTKSHNGIIMSWIDYRNSPCRDVYAQQISIFGELGDIPLPNGDLNLNLTTDILDIIQAIEIILEVNEGTDYQMWAADVNEDFIIDMLDIIIIVNIILD